MRGAGKAVGVGARLDDGAVEGELVDDGRAESEIGEGQRRQGEEVPEAIEQQCRQLAAGAGFLGQLGVAPFRASFAGSVLAAMSSLLAVGWRSVFQSRCRRQIRS